MKSRYGLTKQAKNNLMKSVYMFDWDDEYKINWLIREKLEYDVNEFAIEEISREDGDNFLDKWYVNSDIYKSEIYIGLLRDNEIYQVVGFSRYNKGRKYDYELMCNSYKENIHITNGLFMALDYFKYKYSPKSICTFVDRSKFSSEEFKIVGFKIKNIIGPIEWYIEGKSRIQKTKYTKELSKQGFSTTFDCGYIFMTYKC